MGNNNMMEQRNGRVKNMEEMKKKKERYGDEEKNKHKGMVWYGEKDVGKKGSDKEEEYGRLRSRQEDKGKDRKG